MIKCILSGYLPAGLAKNDVISLADVAHFANMTAESRSVCQQIASRFSFGALEAKPVRVRISVEVFED